MSKGKGKPKQRSNPGKPALVVESTTPATASSPITLMQSAPIRIETPWYQTNMAWGCFTLAFSAISIACGILMPQMEFAKYALWVGGFSSVGFAVIASRGMFGKHTSFAAWGLRGVVIVLASGLCTWGLREVWIHRTIPPVVAKSSVVLPAPSSSTMPKVPSAAEIAEEVLKRLPLPRQQEAVRCLESTDLPIRFTPTFPIADKEQICEIVTAFTHYLSGLGLTVPEVIPRIGDTDGPSGYIRDSGIFAPGDVLISNKSPNDAFFLVRFSSYIIETNLRLASPRSPQYARTSCFYFQEYFAKSFVYKDKTDWHLWLSDGPIAHLLWNSRTRFGHKEFDPIVEATLRNVRFYPTRPPDPAIQKAANFEAYFVGKLIDAADEEDGTKPKDYARAIFADAVRLNLIGTMK